MHHPRRRDRSGSGVEGPLSLTSICERAVGHRSSWGRGHSTQRVGDESVRSAPTISLMPRRSISVGDRVARGAGVGGLVRDPHGRGTRSRLRLRDLQVERLMRPSRVVVADEVTEHVLQVALIHDDHMVEALPAQRADQPLGDAVGLRRRDRREHGLDADPPRPGDEVPPRTTGRDHGSDTSVRCPRASR